MNALPLPPSAKSSGSKDVTWKTAPKSSTRLVLKSEAEAIKVMRAQEWEIEEGQDLLVTPQGNLIPEGRKTPKLEPRKDVPKGYMHNCQVFPDEYVKMYPHVADMYLKEDHRQRTFSSHKANGINCDTSSKDNIIRTNAIDYHRVKLSEKYDDVLVKFLLGRVQKKGGR
jgi:hypothetical protein